MNKLLTPTKVEDESPPYQITSKITELDLQEGEITENMQVGLISLHCIHVALLCFLVITIRAIHKTIRVPA